jgi:hypothetical protein
MPGAIPPANGDELMLPLHARARQSVLPFAKPMSATGSYAFSLKVHEQKRRFRHFSRNLGSEHVPPQAGVPGDPLSKRDDRSGACSRPERSCAMAARANEWRGNRQFMQPGRDITGSPAWVDLIHCLNEPERERLERRQSEPELCGRPPTAN